MNEQVLSLTGICKSYNPGQANEVSIAGLLDTADSGQLQIAGRDMSRADDRLRTDLRRMEIGFVYQFHHLLPEFTAAENIMLPQQAAGKAVGSARKRALELLDQTGLAERADHRPSELSGGEQQRVAFCRAAARMDRQVRLSKGQIV